MLQDRNFICGYKHCIKTISKIVDAGDSLVEKEASRFLYDGIALSEYEQLLRESQLLISSLAYDIDFDHKKYAVMNKFLKELENQITIQPSRIEQLKRVIVHMDMEFCLDVSFYTTLDYINKHCNPVVFCYDNNPQEFSFRWLSNQYGKI